VYKTIAIALLLSTTVASPVMAAPMNPGSVALAKKFIKKLSKAPLVSPYGKTYDVAPLNNFASKGHDVRVSIGEDGQTVIVQAANGSYLKDVHDIVVGNRRGGMMETDHSPLFHDQLPHHGEMIRVQTQSP
jgi:hypothetical protein